MTIVPALVTDVDLRNAVAGVRGLGRANIPVVGISAHRAAAGLRSRYVMERARGPNVLTDPACFVESIARVAKRCGPIVVYPGREEALDALLDHQAELPPEAILPYPSPAIVRSLRYKPGLAALAESVGLSSPRTLVEASAAELARSAVPVPCVAKEVAPGGAVELTTVIETVAELEAFLLRLPEHQPLLLQERVAGPLGALSLVLSRKGEVAARFQQVASRTWPQRAGPSSLAVSVEPDERLVEKARRLLAAAGYWGFAELQFLGVGETPALIDINPRFYGSLPLALACGVNLPASWHGVTLDGSVGSRPAPYRVGVSYRWLEADLSAALQGAPRRLFARRSGPRVGAMWASDDVVPSALLTAQAVTERVNRLILRRAAAAFAHTAGAGSRPA